MDFTAQQIALYLNGVIEGNENATALRTRIGPRRTLAEAREHLLLTGGALRIEIAERRNLHAGNRG